MVTRPVDEAMAEDRPAKAAVRQRWVDCLIELDARWEGREPLYLTLPGAEGRDVALAVQHGVIALNEAGSIAEESLHKVVAVERGQEAALQLRRRFPGLKILDQPIQSLVRGEGLTSYPEAEHRVWCRALVVNLDLSARLEGEARAGGISFPVVSWIGKLAVLHAQEPIVPWTLLLTMNAEPSLAHEGLRDIGTLFRENISLSPAFRERLADLVGPTAVEGLSTEATDPLGGSDDQTLRSVVVAAIPKLIAGVVPEGWVMRSEWCLRYGGESGHAGMIAYRFDFTLADGNLAPVERYKHTVDDLLRSVERIEEDGTVL